MPSRFTFTSSSVNKASRNATTRISTRTRRTGSTRISPNVSGSWRGGRANAPELPFGQGADGIDAEGSGALLGRRHGHDRGRQDQCRNRRHLPRVAAMNHRTPPLNRIVHAYTGTLPTLRRGGPPGPPRGKARCHPNTWRPGGSRGNTVGVAGRGGYRDKRQGRSRPAMSEASGRETPAPGAALVIPTEPVRSAGERRNLAVISFETAHRPRPRRDPSTRCARSG